MANEQIEVVFGGNLGPLQTALRGMKGMMTKAADSIKDSFKDAFHHLTAPLSIAGAFEAVRGLMEDVKNIKRISESTGLSTGVTQDMLNLGKASGLAFGEIESAMDKFVKGLAPGSDVDSALNNLADKMAAVEDPATRAQMATEAFGRSGVKLIPILEQGADGIRKMSEEWGKLDEAQIKEMEHANQVIEKAQSKGKVLLAEWLEGVKDTFQKLKEMPASAKVMIGPLALLEAMREARKDTTPDQPDIVSEKALPTPANLNKAKIAAATEAAKEIADKEEYLFAKPQEKVLALTRQILALRRQIEDATDAKEQLKLGDEMVELEGKRKSIQDEIASKQKAADEAHKRAIEDEKKRTEDIAHTRNEISKLGRQRSAEQMADYMPSLEELANSGRVGVSGSAYVWQQGPFAAMARQLLNLQSDAKQSLIWGNQDRFKQDVSRIDDLKKALIGNNVMSPDDRLQSIDDKIGESTGHLRELINTAKGNGIIVKGTE
jgi:hypothetical protein